MSSKLIRNLTSRCVPSQGLEDQPTSTAQQHACAQQHRAPQITLQEYRNPQQLTDRVPIKGFLREPPKLRLRSRRPFVIEAAQHTSLNQTEQEIWEQSLVEGVPPGHDLVTNPNCTQPDLGPITLPKRQFFTLNRLRCGHARCAECLHRSGMIASPACPYGESYHTTRHEWLSRLSMKL